MSPDTHQVGSQDEVTGIVRETLELVLDRPIAPGEAVCRDDEPAWDSLRHIDLVFALEGAFDIQFGLDEIAELTSLTDIVELVRARHAA